jgi:heterodisulfide reductase subunit B
MKTLEILYYYPGCALFDKAEIFDKSTKESFAVLGVKLEELPDWTCCGAYVSLMDGNSAWLIQPIRNLINTANQHSYELVTGCSCCYNVLKRANNVMRMDAGRRETVNLFLETNEDDYYSGQVDVLHLLEVLRNKIGFDKVAKKVKKDLSELKIAAYYGCNLVRPWKEIGLDKPEQPKILDDFIESIGAQAIDYPYKSICCSKGLSADKRFAEIAILTSQKIVFSAKDAGAEIMITSCPLCLYNLKQCQKDLPIEEQIPIFYFTEILAKALGIEE